MLRIWCCHRLQHGSQIYHRSGVAVAIGAGLQLQLQCNPSPRNFHLLRVRPLKKNSCLSFRVITFKPYPVFLALPITKLQALCSPAKQDCPLFFPLYRSARNDLTHLPLSQSHSRFVTGGLLFIRFLLIRSPPFLL